MNIIIKSFKQVIKILNLRKIKYIKNYSINQVEIVLLSAVFYINSIVSARNLTSSEFGDYAILYSIFNLIQGGYIYCIGETFLIKKSTQYIKQPISEITFFCKYLIIIFIIVGLVLNSLFEFSLSNILIYLFSIFNLIIMQNNRYYFLSYNLYKRSIFNTILFLFILTIYLFLLTIFKINLSTSYLYFSLLGFAAFFVNLINLSQIDFRNRISKLKENKKLILKSLYSQIVFWFSGNFHWILLGYFSRESLGIIKACFTVINPIHSISRGMSITVFKILNNNNNVKTFMKLSLIGMIISIFTLFIWFTVPYKILELTIGQKYFPYKNVVSIIMFVPGISFIASLGNSFLKFNNYFKPIYISNILISLFLSGFILLNQNNYNINSIAIAALVAVIFNFSMICFNVIKKYQEV